MPRKVWRQESVRHSVVDTPHRVAGSATEGRESCQGLRPDLGSWRAAGGLYDCQFGEVK